MTCTVSHDLDSVDCNPMAHFRMFPCPLYLLQSGNWFRGLIRLMFDLLGKYRVLSLGDTCLWSLFLVKLVVVDAHCLDLNSLGL